MKITDKISPGLAAYNEFVASDDSAGSNWLDYEQAAREHVERQKMLQHPTWLPVSLCRQFLYAGQSRLAAMLDHRNISQEFLATTLATFGISKHVYKFDPWLEHELQNTSMDMPIDLRYLLRLPHNGFYIETEFVAEKRAQGVYVAVIDTNTQENPAPTLAIIEHGLDGTFAWQASIDISERIISPRDYLRGKLAIYKRDLFSAEERSGAEIAQLVAVKEPLLLTVYQKVLPLVLYLCSEEPDIESLDVNAAASGYRESRKNAGWKPHLRQHPINIWLVGQRLGTAFKKWREGYSPNPNALGMANTNKGAPKSPHIRAAHWHTYLTGSRLGERKRVLKWIPPTFINCDIHEASELPATARSVKHLLYNPKKDHNNE